MKVASQICDEFTARDIFNSFNDNYSDSTIRATVSNLAPRFNDTMEFCQFSDILRCSELFYPIITEEGLCYTFNSFNVNDMITDEYVDVLSQQLIYPQIKILLMVDLGDKMYWNYRAEPDTFDINAKRPPPTDWKSEKGYDQAAKDPYPYRVYGTGPHSSLFVILRLYDYDIDYMCAGAVEGFKVTFQSPHEQPQLWKNYYYISPGRAAMFKVSPNLVGTSPSLSGYSPSVKHCFFKTERKLRFFKEYTQVFITYFNQIFVKFFQNISILSEFGVLFSAKLRNWMPCKLHQGRMWLHKIFNAKYDMFLIFQEHFWIRD